jgi:hypothetical protein
MTTADAALPSYVDVLGGPIDAPGVARLIAEYDLQWERLSETGGWFENEQRGLSLYCRSNEIEAILHLSSVLGYQAFDGPLPLGLTFADRKEDVLRRLGPPDHQIGPRSTHAGILRYNCARCWVAVPLSPTTGTVQQVTLESLACAARFVTRPGR